MATIRVQTTQNVSLEYEVASIGDRIVAAILDNLILFAWIGAVVALGSVIMPKGRGMDGLWVALLVVLVGIPYVFYNLACEVFLNGQSLGKKARNIRVIRLDGAAPRLGDYLLRWLLRIVDTVMFSGMVAVITIAANGKGQRVGDIAAGTTVIKVQPIVPQVLPSVEELAEVAVYQPVFPQAALLADHDVALVRQLLQRATAQHNAHMLAEIATKVKSLINIQTDMHDAAFLQTVLRDHEHLAGQ